MNEPLLRVFSYLLIVSLTPAAPTTALKQMSSIAVRPASKPSPTKATWRSTKSTSTVPRGFSPATTARRPSNGRRMWSVTRNRCVLFGIHIRSLLRRTEREGSQAILCVSVARQVHERSSLQYICPDCGKSLSSKTALMLHQRTHTGTRPYECPDCQARFTQNSALKMHRRYGSNPWGGQWCEPGRTHACLVSRVKDPHWGEAFCVRPVRGPLHAEAHAGLSQAIPHR